MRSSTSNPSHPPDAAWRLPWHAAFAIAALILYPLAISLPVLELRKLGHIHEVTVWSGAVSLVSEGQVAVGLLVFTCSIIIPFLKLSGILLLSTERPWRGQSGVTARRHTHLTIDALGRWGMLDVLLAAILVAAIKLGNWADIHTGPGVFVFAAMVAMSLLASGLFNPRPFPFPSPSGGGPGWGGLELHK
jgi:paraquat-inducible protein A